MSRRLLSEYYKAPGMWQLNYEGDEDVVYIPPEGKVYIPTNVYFDFNFSIPYAFLLSDEFYAEQLSLSSLLIERGKEIRVSFTRPSTADTWIRVHSGACIGFIYPTCFF